MPDGSVEMEGVNVHYEGFHALHDIMLSVKPGELMAIIGPNGCGKSTTMRTINGLLKAVSGSLTVCGLDVRSVSLEEMAKLCSNIPTEFPPDFNLSVYEVVMLGRYPHRKNVWWETDEDEEVVKDALRMFGIDHLFDRDITQLSSGCFIARKSDGKSEKNATSDADIIPDAISNSIVTTISKTVSGGQL